MNQPLAYAPTPAGTYHGTHFHRISHSARAFSSHKAFASDSAENAPRTGNQAALPRVSLLFTRYSDPVSRFVSLIGKHGFSHVSVSVQSEPTVFYSFNHKGFAIEKPLKHMPKRRLPGNLLVSFEVPEHVHQALQAEIDRFLQHREAYRYSPLGVACCLAHIPVNMEGRRFRSQFVAEVLERAGMVQLGRHTTLCLPEHLIDRALYAFPPTNVVSNWP